MMKKCQGDLIPTRLTRFACFYRSQEFKLGNQEESFSTIVSKPSFRDGS